ncbi:hypothetical protein LINPERPRIM_LOCUS35196 [Linum perenne]
MEEAERVEFGGESVFQENP